MYTLRQYHGSPMHYKTYCVGSLDECFTHLKTLVSGLPEQYRTIRALQLMGLRIEPFGSLTRYEFIAPPAVQADCITQAKGRAYL